MSRIQARSEWQSIIALKVTAPQDMFALARLDVRRVMTETAQNEPRAAPTFTIFALIHRPYDVLGGRKLMLPNDSLTIEERDAQAIVGSGGSDLKEDVCCPRWQTIRRWPGEPRSAASNVFRPPGFAALGKHARLGDAVLAAQAAYAETGAFAELLGIYHLLGDPALKLQ